MAAMQYQYARPANMMGGLPTGVPSPAFVGGAQNLGAQNLGGSALQGYSGQAFQGMAAPQGQQYASPQYSVAAPSLSAPLTPKIATVPGTSMAEMAGKPQPAAPLSVASPAGVAAKPLVTGASPLVAWASGVGEANSMDAKPAPAAATSYVRGGREQALEQRVRELESLLAMKEKTIQELQSALASAKGTSNQKGNSASKVRSPGRSGSGFRKVSESKPVIRYTASDQDDPIDVRLEEFYNSTGSAIQFRRINRGFYRFGDSIVELDIINHKLMARTEDGWNRGKFGPIEKFLMYYENIEREKAGILPES